MWHSLLVAGVIAGPVGFIVCGALVGFNVQRAKDRRWLAAVGPLDALKVVEGARFPCEASPSFPERVFVSVAAGRILQFKRC